MSYDGKPLPGSAGDPLRPLAEAYGAIYFVGGLATILGLVAELSHDSSLQSLGFGRESALGGLVFVGLGLWVHKRQSLVALSIVAGLFALDGLVTLMTFEESNLPSAVGGILVKFLLLALMWRGFAAIRDIRRSKRLSHATPPPIQPQEVDTAPRRTDSIGGVHAAYEAGTRSTKRCPWCAEEIQEAAVICRYCGREVSTERRQTSAHPGRPCPKCETPVHEGQFFCPKCGQDVRKAVHHWGRTAAIVGGITLASAVLVALFLSRPGSTKEWSKSVASLHVLDADGNALAQGSGFLIDDAGDLATNFHVVGGGEKVRVELPDGQVTETTTLVGADEYLDLAILKTDLRGLEPLRLADQQPQVGDEVTVLGSPLGLTNTLSKGVVSGIRSLAGKDLYQITAPISPGSSGGPVLDGRGRVVGLATASLTIGQNLNFAVPAVHLRHLIGTQTRELRLLGRSGTGLGLIDVANRLEAGSSWSDSLGRLSFERFKRGLGGVNTGGGWDAVYVGKMGNGWFLLSMLQATDRTAFGTYCSILSSPGTWSSREICPVPFPFKAMLYQGGYFVGTLKPFTQYDSISVNTTRPDLWGVGGSGVLGATWRLFTDTLVGLYGLEIPSPPSGSVAGVWDILYPEPDQQGLQGRMALFQNGSEVVGVWMEQQYSSYQNRVAWTQMSTLSGTVNGTTVTFRPTSYVLTCQGQLQTDGMTGTCTSQLKSGRVSRVRFEATRRAH